MQHDPATASVSSFPKVHVLSRENAKNQPESSTSYGSIFPAPAVVQQSSKHENSFRFLNDGKQKKRRLSGLLLLSVLVLVSCHVKRKKSFGNNIQHQEKNNKAHDEIIPTLLSVVQINSNDNENQNGSLVHALKNPLHALLRQPSSFHTKSKQEEVPVGIHVFPDRSTTQFGEALSVQWSSHEHQSDDVIAMYCPHDEPNAIKFKDAATVEQAMASTAFFRQGQAKEQEDRQPDVAETWFIPSFPVIREETCEFRLYHRRLIVNEDDIATIESKHDSLRGQELLSNPSQYELVGRSLPITLENAIRTPTGIHLALTGRHDEMHVHFATGHNHRSKSSSPTLHQVVPVVQYWKFQAQEGESNKNLAHGSYTTYAASDLCSAPATEEAYFSDPGLLHLVTITGLEEANAEYAYRVAAVQVPRELWESTEEDAAEREILLNNVMQEEEDDAVWSEVFTFQSPPLPHSIKNQLVQDSTTTSKNENFPFRFIIYGDQGCPKEGWANGGAQLTTKFVERESRSGHMVKGIHHIGDLSYAQGVGHVWDAWLQMIQPITARIPLMIAVGNHEYDYTTGALIPTPSKDTNTQKSTRDPSGYIPPSNETSSFEPSWGNFANDGGGECGVPMAKHFQGVPSLPNEEKVGPNDYPNNGVFWYSYNYGPLHIVVISSEHDLYPQSPQHVWLEQDLQAVNREETPWVIVECHRPMYQAQAVIESEDGVDYNRRVGLGMRKEFEFLLKEYAVDVYFAGHYHSYLRTCSGLYQGECDNGGPMHITVGSAGAALLEFPLYEEDKKWTEEFLVEWGYGRLTVWNETALHFEFVSDTDGEIRDDFWFVKEMQ